MTLFTFFVISVLLTVLFLVFKYFEIKKDLMFFADVRNKIDRKVIRIVVRLYSFFLALPTLFSPKKIFLLITKKGMHCIAACANAMEKKAHKIAMKLSYAEDENDKRKPSDFLREVSEHKDNLDKDFIKRDIEKLDKS